MYAVAQAVVERDDEKSGMVEPGGGLADFLRFFLFGHSCSLSAFGGVNIALRASYDRTSSELRSSFARVKISASRKDK